MDEPGPPPGDILDGPTPGKPNKTSSKARKQAPQITINKYWKSFNSKYPGKAIKLLPLPQSKPAQPPKNAVAHGQQAVKSYEEARRECEHAVDLIVKQCMRSNQKYTDIHFDIEEDLKSGNRLCLDGLGSKNKTMRPKGVKRVTDIFEDPQFYVKGATAGDVQQGNDGDCWLMAALCTLGNKEGLIDRICVARDELVGVYGFVFHRDGEWRHTIVDDKLYLRAPDYDDAVEERQIWDEIGRADTEDRYRKTWQTGSKALYFAQCSDENETWLPLLEKAYAKAHGDFSCIEGGFVGEALEDLTGGVTSEILSSNILSKERFWKEDLMNVNKHFLFGCSTGLNSDWLYPTQRFPSERSGIHEAHAYSVMEAREVNGERLLRLRNPWGQKEWNGPWSDGSEQWTPEWMQLLDHKFGNDGVFWISYKDFLRKYEHFDRTRLFGPEWTIAQKWTSVQVPWSAEYHSTRFLIEITETTPVVIVLSQLDDRYFEGLTGQYDFFLQFRVEPEGESDYIARSQTNTYFRRSVNTEITLDPGRYIVLMKITAFKTEEPPVEEVVKFYSTVNREKLVQIGRSYDLAHSKALEEEETEKEKADRKAREAKKKAAERQKLREKTERQKFERWSVGKKVNARERRAQLKTTRVRGRRAARDRAMAEQMMPGREGEACGPPPDADAGREGGPVVVRLPPTCPNVETGNNNSDEKLADDVNPDDSGEGAVNDTVKETKKYGDTSNNEHVDSEKPNIGKPRSDKAETAPEEKGSGTTVSIADEGNGNNVEIEESNVEEPKSQSGASPDATVTGESCHLNDKEGEVKEKQEEKQEEKDSPQSKNDFIKKSLEEGEIPQGTDPYDSDDSFCDFEFDSEIDLPPEESDYETDRSTGAESEAADKEEECNTDPWNAVCVVGLRVYSKDPKLSLRLLKPKNEEDVGPAPDIDDPSAQIDKDVKV